MLKTTAMTEIYWASGGQHRRSIWYDRRRNKCLRSELSSTPVARYQSASGGGNIYVLSNVMQTGTEEAEKAVIRWASGRNSGCSMKDSAHQNYRSRQCSGLMLKTFVITLIQWASGEQDRYPVRYDSRWKNACDRCWGQIQWPSINQHLVGHICVLLNLMRTGMEEEVHCSRYGTHLAMLGFNGHPAETMDASLDIMRPKIEEVENCWDRSWVELQWKWVD